MKPDCVIHHGDCRKVLATLPEKSVQAVICSPPYWRLRKYEGVEPSWWGHLDGCSHAYTSPAYPMCPGCGGWFGLLGLEPTIEMYIEHIVECFRAVKRVLRDDGTLWLNISDKRNAACTEWLGMPHDVRKALQADGWLYADEIVWYKPNPMPEPTTKRTTRAHEYLFLLTKRPKYYYDAEAVREKAEYGYREHTGEMRSVAQDGYRHTTGTTRGADPSMGRNKRSVWTIPTEANPEAHFASFPRKLVLPCVLAGTSEKGCCPECGTPWRGVVEKDRQSTRPARDNKQDDTGMAKRDHERHITHIKTLGWEPGCDCYERYSTSGLTRGCPEVQAEWLTEPCTVCDPMCGSGTTGIVATQQGRRFIGIDASAEYCDMARRRIENPEPEPEIPDVAGQMMFGELTQ